MLYIQHYIKTVHFWLKYNGFATARKTTKLIEGGHRGFEDYSHTSTFFTFFLKIQKVVTFYVFLPCFVRFLELWGQADKWLKTSWHKHSSTRCHQQKPWRNIPVAFHLREPVKAANRPKTGTNITFEIDAHCCHMGTAIASCARPGWAVICDIWHPSKCPDVKNYEWRQPGLACFIAVPMATMGIKGLITNMSLPYTVKDNESKSRSDYHNSHHCSQLSSMLKNNPRVHVITKIKIGPNVNREINMSAQ